MSLSSVSVSSSLPISLHFCFVLFSFRSPVILTYLSSSWFCPLRSCLRPFLYFSPHKQNYFKDAWNIFDCVTVLGSITDILVTELGVSTTLFILICRFLFFFNRNLYCEVKTVKADVMLLRIISRLSRAREAFYFYIFLFIFPFFRTSVPLSQRRAAVKMRRGGKKHEFRVFRRCSHVWTCPESLI